MTRVLMSGNDAVVEGAIRAGVDCYFGYPITPQNEIIAGMAARLPPLGRVFLQSESELAAISMVHGAAAAGKRAMTTSSSPGISLMQEGISYIAGTRVPGVIVNVQRGGPGLGNIAAAQGDYFQATRGGGNGDYRTIVLAPPPPRKCSTSPSRRSTWPTSTARRCMMLSDGRLGQTMEAVELRDPAAAEAPVEKPWALTGAKGRDRTTSARSACRRPNWPSTTASLQKVYREIERREPRAELYQDGRRQPAVRGLRHLRQALPRGHRHAPRRGLESRPVPPDHPLAVPEKKLRRGQRRPAGRCGRKSAPGRWSRTCGWPGRPGAD